MKNLLQFILSIGFIIAFSQCNNNPQLPENTITDQDGNNYPISSACNQIWTAKNLNTSKYRNGVNIPRVSDPVQWSNLTTGAYCSYNNDSSNDAIYGKLYNWYAINDTINGGICPNGWHVASNSEWETLASCLGGRNVAGGKLKETGTAHWNTPNVNASNTIRFSSIGNGNRDTTGTYFALKEIAYYWTSTESDLDSRKAFYYTTNRSNSVLDWSDWKKTDGFAVRLVKD
jgi:uncharacterized protein (TIGR02145 family)